MFKIKNLETTVLDHDPRKNMYSSRSYKFMNVLIVNGGTLMSTRTDPDQVVLGVHSLEDRFWRAAGWG